MACTILAIDKKPCGVINVPGITKLFATPIEDIDGELSATDGVVSTITNAAGKNFLEIQFTNTSGEVMSNYNAETEDAESFTHECVITNGYLDGAKFAAIESYAGAEVILVAKASTGKYFIVGDQDAPAKLRTAEITTGTREEGNLAGATLTFRAPLVSHGLWEFTGTESDLTTAGV